MAGREDVWIKDWAAQMTLIQFFRGGIGSEGNHTIVNAYKGKKLRDKL